MAPPPGAGALAAHAEARPGQGALEARHRPLEPDREHAARAEAYDLVRRMVRALGKKFASSGIIADGEDIFYLEMDEIRSFVEGTSTCTNLAGLVALRKKEYEDHRRYRPPDHIETHGEIYLWEAVRADPARADTAEVLKGVGCCRGMVQGSVVVVEKPEANLELNGKILVAPQTDPGWVVFFPSIAGLIIERGSVLSHSAIVAREMGIPTVVGVTGAATLLETGDTVRLEGSKGEVEIIKRNRAA